MNKNVVVNAFISQNNIKIIATAKQIDAKFKAKGYRLVPKDTHEMDIYLEERANCL